MSKQITSLDFKKFIIKIGGCIGGKYSETQLEKDFNDLPECNCDVLERLKKETCFGNPKDFDDESIVCFECVVKDICQEIAEEHV